MSEYVNSAEIPDEFVFEKERQEWRDSLARDLQLRSDAVQLQIKAEKYRYTYQHEWMGIPVIRLPDDILLQQEIVHHLRPSSIIETGVARGGSVVLSACLMEINSITPHVLGLDLLIMPHATNAIDSSKFGKAIKLWQGDSSSDHASQVAKEFLSEKPEEDPVLLILDSDHSEEHVLSELRNFCDLLPAGSIVMVADTIIEEFPIDYYRNRPWNVGNNPLTAVRKFLDTDNRFMPLERWNRRSLLSEFRDGIIEKIKK